jgi:hypothetical protein
MKQRRASSGRDLLISRDTRAAIARAIQGGLTRSPVLSALAIVAVLASLGAVAIAIRPVVRSITTPPAIQQQGKISTAEFSRLVRDFSEPGGYFWSDNLISNETSYLHIVPKLRQLGATGGAYIGVGPEQNFTYIAKIRPRIAFIIDIRRQAIIQHLMFKAIFGLSRNRAEFLSRLLSKPLSGKGSPGPDASVQQLLDYFSSAPTDPAAFKANLAELRNLITHRFEVQLTVEDQAGLEKVYGSFRDEGLDISFRLGAGGNWDGFFPTLKALIAEHDLTGATGNFLANSDDYEFVRKMQEENRIIPVVGDFAGNKALISIGNYLRKNGYTVTAFYLSNVEQYLFQSGVFGAFAENVRKLPLTDKSLFIRSVFDRFVRHPAQVPGHRVTTVLQPIQVFLKDYDQGRCRDYSSVVTTDYVAAGN